MFNALRALRVTELRDSFPAHVVDAWIGHDDTVARKHYAQALDEHYERALQKCSHFPSSMDTHREVPMNENVENPVLHGIVSHGVVNQWAILDSNQFP
jgi:hypothetical protein